MAKVGEEIYVEPSLDGLTLKTVNSCRSAFATFCFGSAFFSAIEQTEAESEESCKVMVRGLLLAFKSLSTLEKTVESCVLETAPGQDSLSIILHCRHTINKHFQVTLMECDTQRAEYNLAACTNNWEISARVMDETANGNFLANQEEVTMFVTPDSFKMKNFNEEYEEAKQVHTQLLMQPGEFDKYEIRQSGAVTFCLKEFRSVLSFADFLQLQVRAAFSTGGRPLVVTAYQGQQLSCTYVLATLAEDGTAPPPSPSMPSTATPQPRHAPFSSSAVTPRGGVTTSTQQPGTAPRPPSTPSLSNISAMVSSPVLGRPHDPGSEDTVLLHQEEPQQQERDLIPASPPPSKKRNFLFRRCFDATFRPSGVPGADRILAPDSDEEN